jgi:2,4-dienoyl-CoA reductase-like NADH-dependent reductase (Old Yellow Enzyme family)
MAEVTLQQLFTPGKIGGVSIPNRIVCTSMVTNYCDDDGRATDRFVDYFEAKARGGYGLIMSEALVVDPAGKGFANEAGI